MAKRGASGEGNGGALVIGSRASFFWGILAGVVLSVAVCHFWCGARACMGGGMHGGMGGCTYMEKMAPAPEGKTAPSK